MPLPLIGMLAGGKVPWIAAGLAAAGAVVLYLLWDAADARADLAEQKARTIQEANATLERRIDEIKAQRDHAEGQAAAYAEAAQQWETIRDDLREQARRLAADGQECPVAPSVRSVLDGLRGPGAGGQGGG